MPHNESRAIRSISARPKVDHATGEAIVVLQAKCAALKAEISELAAEGRTMECDDKHSQIDALERAMSILIGE